MSEGESEVSSGDRMEMDEEGPSTAAMRIAVGDELGVLRVVEIPSRDRWHGAKVTRKWGPDEGGPPSRDLGIKSMTASSREGLTDTESSVVCLSRVNGAIEIYGSEDFSVRGIVKPFMKTDGSDKGSESQIVAMAPCWTPRNDRVPSILSCCEAGVVRLSKPSRKRENLQLKESMSLLVADSITSASADLERQILAVGGDGCHLRLVNLESQKIAFKGKPCENPYGLTRRNWTTCCQLVPDTDCKLILVGTADHEIRLYDVRVGKKPVSKMEWKESRVMAMAPESNSHHIWMANATGHIERYDVEGRCVRGALKGRITGSIRSLATHPDRPLIASAGLDRCLRLHDTASKTMRVKIYVKYQCTGVAFLPVPEGYEGECATKTALDEADEERKKVAAMIGGQNFSVPSLRAKRRSGDAAFSRSGPSKFRRGSSFKRPKPQ